MGNHMLEVLDEQATEELWGCEEGVATASAIEDNCTDSNRVRVLDSVSDVGVITATCQARKEYEHCCVSVQLLQITAELIYALEIFPRKLIDFFSKPCRMH